MTALRDILLDISNPSSPSYGQHLTKREADKYAAPRAESITAVTSWLYDHGFARDDITISGSQISVHAPLSRADLMPGAAFSDFTHKATGSRLVRTLSYSLPADLDEHVSFIYPTTQFGYNTRSDISAKAGNSKSSRSEVLDDSRTRIDDPFENCHVAVTPLCLQKLYNIPAEPATQQANTLAVSGFNGNVPSHDDLQDFLVTYGPKEGGTYQVRSLNSTGNYQDLLLESDLDIQYTVGLANNVSTTFWSVDGPRGSSSHLQMYELLTALNEEDHPPLVVSTSYSLGSEGEAIDSDDVGKIYHEICDLALQLGTRGTSVIFSSGDGGVAGEAVYNSSCSTQFVPVFPSSCPYVTSVGSTDGFAPETAAAFSAGGFSNMFPRPAYQTSAVDGYLKALGSTNAGRYNVSGRGYPDVSVHGTNFAISVNRTILTVGGTSASAPTFASIVALVNDRLLGAGKRPMGFLNPLLYSKGATAFNDITRGSNPGCGGDGFPALAGWDPVTGLGTPNFNKLLEVAMSVATPKSA